MIASHNSLRQPGLKDPDGQGFPGQVHAQVDDDFVVFLIGMRVNKPWKVNRWWPVASAMPKMLWTLDQHPELGCLGYQSWFGRTTLPVQYWRDFDSLDRFARDKNLPHLEPWRKFNRVIRDSGDVGIWHETYCVKAGAYEAVYGNMPVFGLAPASTHVPVARKAQTRPPGSGSVRRMSLPLSHIESVFQRTGNDQLVPGFSS